MSVVVASGFIQKVSTSSDPKKAIIDAIGDISGFELADDLVLLGIFFRPEKTKGGIIRPDANVEEDAYQGKVGLVLKWGPNAFLNPEDGSTYEWKADVGEWAFFKVGDAWQTRVNGYPCRICRDISIRGKVKDPNIIF